MGVDVALVADDLTGALDAAAPFATHGFEVRVYRTMDALAPAPAAGSTSRPVTAARQEDDRVPPTPDAATALSGPETASAVAADAPPRRGAFDPSGPSGPLGMVLAVNTSTRHLAPAAARVRVEAAGRHLREWSPRITFKKIDSTLRGPVPDEVAAAMGAFGRRTALVCPAFPAAGRIVREGGVLVYGTPLRETEYVLDLRTPAPSEPLEAFIGRAGPVSFLGADRASSDRPLAPGIVLADAETDADLAELAQLVARRPGEVLGVGSDGLAQGLARWLGGEERETAIAGGPGRIVLFTIGSRASTSERQVERLLEAVPGTPVVAAPCGSLEVEAAVRAARSARCAVLRVPPAPRGDPGAIARSFAAGVRAAVEEIGAGKLAALVATGGDTVEAILEAFDIGALDVLGEFRPGIPVSRDRAQRWEFALVSKAGGFGEPDLFARIGCEVLGE